ncbi:MAG: MerR family transcriptional regulator [Bacillota bacterium]|nr:MerR family transcriptional regulator [Bacillota bacterium]
MHSKDQPVYPMRVACGLTGLTERQIRYYDTKGLVSPKRTAGQQRLYSQRDIEALATVARLVAKGHTLDEVAAKLREASEKPQGREMGDARFRTLRHQYENVSGYSPRPELGAFGRIPPEYGKGRVK